MKVFNILLLFISWLPGAMGQWTTDLAANTLVAGSTTDDCQAAGTSDGKTFVVYWVPVSNPTNYQLRCQLLDAAGNQKFGPSGMLVSSSIEMSTFTMIWDMAVSDSNHLFIAVTGSGGDNMGHVFKIDTAGANLWGTNGVIFAQSSGLVPTLRPLSYGELAVAWYPGASHMVLQKFSAAGAPIWSGPAAVSTTDPGIDTYPAAVRELSDGRLIMLFHAKSGFGINSNLWVRKVHSNGDLNWANPVQLSDKSTRFNARYSVAQDEDTVYIGFSAATGLRFDGYVQRINPDGTTWGLNGKDFDTQQTDYEMDISIALDPEEPKLWAICRYTNTSQSLFGERVQRLDNATGTRELGESGLEVFAIDNQYRNHATDLVMLDDKPFFIIKQGLDNGASPVTLKAVQLEYDGTPTFTPAALDVATFGGSKGHIDLTLPVDGQAVVTFAENKGGGTKIYAQNFRAPITAVAPTIMPGEVDLWPNPASGQVNVESKYPIARLSLTTLLGKQVAAEVISHGLRHRVNVSNLPPGLYFLTTHFEGGGTAAQRLLVE